MKDSEAKKVLSILKEVGITSQSKEAISIDFKLSDHLAGIPLEEFKKFEANSNTDLTELELLDIYRIITYLHKAESDLFNKVLYDLRAIRYDSANLDLRASYLNDFENLLLGHAKYCKKDDIDSIKKEMIRLKKFSALKWGFDNKIARKCEQILYELDNIPKLKGKDSNKEWETFIGDWEEINRRFRPDEQALDYASQIIVEQLNK